MTTNQSLGSAATSQFRWTGASVGLAAALAATVTLTVIATQGTGEEGLQLVNRYLARLGFFLFLPTFLASSLHTLWPGATTHALVGSRRALGLAYATVHLSHGAALVPFFATTDNSLSPDLEGIGGALGFFFVITLAATSNDAAVRLLGARSWSTLHRTGVIYLWGIYVFTYIGRVVGWDAFYWPFLAIAVAAMGIRLAAVAKRRRDAARS